MPVPDLSGLTEKYHWACDNNTPVDTRVTIVEPTYNATLNKFSNVVYETQDYRTYAHITFKDSAVGYSEETLKAIVPYRPETHTIAGQIYIPKQHGYYASGNTIELKIALAGGAVYALSFSLAPGKLDQFFIYNGTSGSKTFYDVPRIPRETWVDFILSENMEAGIFHAYTYLHAGAYTFSKSYAIDQGPALEDWCNVWISSASSYINTTISMDNLTWYEEYYMLDDYDPSTEVNNVYYKGFPWIDHVFSWEYANWSSESWDIMINSSIPYYTFFDYYNNFTVHKAVVILDPSQDYNWDINKTLSYDRITEVVYRVGSTPDYDAVLRAISWNKKYNPNGDKIIGASLRDTSSMWGYTNWDANYTHLKDQLDTYVTDIPLFVDIYFVHMEDMHSDVWDLVDGVFLTGWYAEDYGNLNETVNYARSRLGSIKPMWVVGYTVDYGRHEPMEPGFEAATFRDYYYLLTSGKVQYIGIMGPSRFCNYPEFKEVHEYFSKQMAVAYDSDGRAITIYDQEDGTNVKIDHLDIPLKYTSCEDNRTITVISYMDTELEVEIPNNWNLASLEVKDTTTGEPVNWTQGSVIFRSESGHSYQIVDSEYNQKMRILEIIRHIIPRYTYPIV